MQLHKLLGLFGIATTTALLAGAAACGGGEGSGGSGGSGTGTGTGAGTGTGTGTGVGGSGTGTGTGTGTGMGCENNCEPPEPAHEEIVYPVTGNVTGTVLDQAGQPAADMPVDVCGTDLCQFGLTQANGTFSTDSNDNMIKDVRMLYGSGKTFAKMGARIPGCDANSCASPDMGQFNTIRFPDFPQGVDMAPGMDVTQGGVTLSIPADACLSHDLLLYEAGEEVMRAVVLDYDPGPSPLERAGNSRLGVPCRGAPRGCNPRASCRLKMETDPMRLKLQQQPTAIRFRM